ncbi:MAG TPA: HEAT repeat domain-containing protein [Mycobacteriales bacterium]|jgi:hypothetical protein|nr:HEAT repeat domain-containing protein [Mycobacteriales bacterium]
MPDTAGDTEQPRDDDYALVEDLVARAVDAYRALSDDGDLDPIWPLLNQAALRHDFALELASGLAAGTDPAERAVAGLLTGTVADGRERGDWTDKAIQVCTDLLAGQPDNDVHWAVAHALGQMYDPRATTMLLGLVEHEDADVRFKVASGLPHNFGEDGPDDEVVAALIRLSGDEDEDVRDWATFGLGSGIDSVDTDELRAALWARVDDEHAESRNEALAGLAYRHDPRVAPLLLRELESGDVEKITVDAASVLADPILLPALRRLADSDWAADAEADVDRAIERCEPALSGERTAAERRVLDRLLKEAEDDPRFGTRVTGIALAEAFPTTAIEAWVLTGPEPYEERWTVWGDLCGRVTGDGRLAELDTDRAVAIIRRDTGVDG